MKTKHKFNIIDAFVILVLLAIIFEIVFFAVQTSGVLSPENEQKDVTYTVCIHGVDKAYLGSFKKGNHAYNSSTLYDIGIVTEINAVPVIEYDGTAKDSETEGEYAPGFSESDTLYDVYITISAKATVDERGIAFIDTQKIIVGTTVYIRCGDYAAASHVTSFKIG